MTVTPQQEWNRHFVAYEDALASFYSLQDETESKLGQAHTLVREIHRLASLRTPILEAKRRLSTMADDGRVAEIERDSARIEVDGVPFDALDLVATRGTADDTLLELSFRVNPRTVPRFVKLTEPVRIKFPFGASTFIANCRLVRFRLVRDEFAFRFATVDPG